MQDLHSQQFKLLIYGGGIEASNKVPVFSYVTFQPQATTTIKQKWHYEVRLYQDNHNGWHAHWL